MKGSVWSCLLRCTACHPAEKKRNSFIFAITFVNHALTIIELIVLLRPSRFLISSVPEVSFVACLLRGFAVLSDFLPFPFPAPFPLAVFLALSLSAELSAATPDVDGLGSDSGTRSLGNGVVWNPGYPRLSSLIYNLLCQQHCHIHYQNCLPSFGSCRRQLWSFQRRLECWDPHSHRPSKQSRCRRHRRG